MKYHLGPLKSRIFEILDSFIMEAEIDTYMFSKHTWKALALMV